MPSGNLQWVHSYDETDKDTQVTGYSKLLEEVIAADRWNLDDRGVDLVYNSFTKVYNSKNPLFRDLAVPYSICQETM